MCKLQKVEISFTTYQSLFKTNKLTLTIYFILITND